MTKKMEVFPDMKKALAWILVCALCCALFRGIVMTIIVVIRGSASFGHTLFTYVLPCALFTALLCLLLRWPLKPLMERQTKRYFDHKNL